MDPSPLVATENLTKTYGTGDVAVHALSDVTVGLTGGEFTAVVGPSGSGKTTLLHLIGGLDKPTSGTVSLSGTPIAKMGRGKLADWRRDNIGFVFQSYNLIPVLTAAENIEYVLILQGIAAAERLERITAMLEHVALEGLGDRFPKELSGGQQQRVALARAMIASPKLILADEPTANVDSHTACELLDLMLKLNAEKNMTFLFSTHDPMVMERARRVIHLHDGKIEKEESQPTL